MESELQITARKPKKKMQRQDNIIRKFNNTDPSDSSEFVPKSMDVIVDIHQEYKEDKRAKDIKQKETSNESSLLEPNALETFSKTNPSRDKKNKRSHVKLMKHENLKQEHDDIEVVDSLDLIEEFHDPSNSKTNDYNLEATTEKLSINEYVNQPLFEERSHNRKQWAIVKKHTEEPTKPRRKRWSKDTSVIRLPEAKTVPWGRTRKSLPAIRHSSLPQKSSFTYYNKAFAFENEEILRIETDQNRKDTKIEMKELVDKSEDVIDNQSSQDSSNETAIMVEDLNESPENASPNAKPSSSSSNAKKQHSNSNNMKDISDHSNSSQNLESLSIQSDHSSAEVSSKDDQLENKAKSTRNRKQYSKSATEDDDLKMNPSRNSSESSVEDDLDKDRSRGFVTSYENKLRSTAKRKQSKHREHSEAQSKKEKKKSLRKDISGSSTHMPSVHTEEDSKRKKKKKKKNDSKYTSITIHRADMLKIDYLTKHPMVKVHIVQAENGKYLKCDHGTATYLQPVITGKYDFRENKSIIPVWEEELIFEHDFNALLKTDNERVVILFEIIDLLSFAEASFNYDKFGHDCCWYKVAWSFLKPVGRCNVLHVNKRLRLQLYKPRKNFKKFDSFHTCEVYTWWKSNIREKYPSTLFVTIKSIDPPKLEPVLYQQLSLYDLSKTSNESKRTSVRASDLISLPNWTRLAAQSCKIPNEIVFETDTSENGSFYVAFSNNGKYLACSFSEEHDYPIIVYEVESKRIHVRFSGHKTFIYSLDWSNNDRYLLSVSSDQTARIWDVQNQIVQHIEMMPHPLYVYCGKFDPDVSSIVATGCYDRVTRIWMRDKKSKNRDLSQELEGHEGFVNSMCFQKNSNLLTADSVGIIIIWTVKKNRRIPSRKEWHISRKIRVRDIDGVIINTILLHPLESRLLVHSRNNGLRLLDLATGVALQKYSGLNNQRIQSTACISPCGGLILCGGEDSSLNVWNLESGSLLGKYTFDRNSRAITCVDYHPYDHMLAFATFGNPTPVKVMRFNKDTTGENVGLKTFEEFENTVNNSDVPMRLLNTSVKSREKLQLKDKEERIPRSSRNYDLSLYKSPDSVHSEKDDKYNNTRLKLQRLNEAGQTLKNRSANRLYNIIEKIDRILWNTSRSSGDVESGWNLALIPESSTGKLTSLSENVEKNKSKLNKYKSGYLSNENQSNSYVDSTSSDTHEIVELRTIEDIEKRPKSAREIRSNDVCKDDLQKTFSDSATGYQKTKVHHATTKTILPKNIETSFIVKRKETHNSESIKSNKNNRFSNDDTNSSGSTGTYIVEKNGASNSDKNTIKILEDKDLISSDVENESNNAKRSDSDNSVLSNATFTIENEVPVPKPRKKINLRDF